jgi:hypothetical protein
MMGGLEATMRMRQIEREEGSAPPSSNGNSSEEPGPGNAPKAALTPLALPNAAVPLPLPHREAASHNSVSPVPAASSSLASRSTPPLHAYARSSTVSLPLPRRTFIACVSGNVRDEFVHAARMAGVDTYIGQKKMGAHCGTGTNARRAAHRAESC